MFNDARIPIDAVGDLATEHAIVRDLVDGLAPQTWERPTPAVGWTVVDQVNHLAWTTERARMAVSEPDRFAAASEHDRQVPRMDEMVRRWGRSLRTDELLNWYDAVTGTLVDDLRKTDLGQRVPWYGPSMRVGTLVAARIMETWAHGRDIAMAVGRRHPATERLWYVCDLGVRTRRWSFAVHGLAEPTAEISVVLRAPGASRWWSWGSSGAAQSVTGDAEAFSLVVTQRRNVGDAALTVEGPEASDWMACAQAFAGPPTYAPPRAVGR